MYGFLGAFYLRETSSVRGFPRELYSVTTVLLVSLQWPRAVVTVGGWMTFGWCLFPVTQFLSVWAQVET